MIAEGSERILKGATTASGTLEAQGVFENDGKAARQLSEVKRAVKYRRIEAVGEVPRNGSIWLGHAMKTDGHHREPPALFPDYPHRSSKFSSAWIISMTI